MAAPRLPRDRLTFWTIYRNPRDHPGKWVLRGHDVLWKGPNEVRAQPEAFVCETLEEARSHVPYGLIRLPPDPNDDPVICEVWV